ncbi:unnamed protein product [Protopolystoma xenopodis]|uniref:Uncharacterized protein n=1 Tax=Protopolystoma xenopodis TaxID=117903 RepID=A0A448XD96_9PLAT|nr:unnamed protein product [Protopolystoma xenopodis]
MSPPDSGISLSGLSEVEPGTKASIASQQSYITHTSSGPSANSITTHPPGAHRNLGTGPPVLGGMSTGYFSATPERNLSSSSSLVSGRSADTKTAIAATSGSASALITDLAITELRHPANPFDDDTGDSLFPTCVDSADEALLPGNPFGDEALGHSPPQTTKQSRSPPLLNPFD